jgi:hypothetical protein
MGLPPIISLLIETFPIFRRGSSPADDFSAAKMVLVDAANIDVVRDLFKNSRRFILFDILFS